MRSMSWDGRRYCSVGMYIHPLTHHPSPEHAGFRHLYAAFSSIQQGMQRHTYLYIQRRAMSRLDAQRPLSLHAQTDSASTPPSWRIRASRSPVTGQDRTNKHCDAKTESYTGPRPATQSTGKQIHGSLVPPFLGSACSPTKHVQVCCVNGFILL